MASVAEIQPLSTEFDVPGTESKSVVEKEITALGKVIFEKATVGLKSATQAVVSDVPEMIRDLTTQIETGSIDSFGKAINKLIMLVDDLGINLRQYNSELADTVDRFRGSQSKLQEELGRLREQGIKAEIDEDRQRIRILTQNDITEYNKQKKVNEESIAKNREEIEQRTKLLSRLEEEGRLTKKDRDSKEQEIKTRAQNIENLQKENDLIDQRTNTTADTGRDVGGFSKLAELKEAFMVIPDTINEVAGGFAQFGKSLMSGFKQFLFAPLKTIGRLFKTIGNIFRSARALIALKVLAVIAAFQFFAEKIDVIRDTIVGVFEKIKDFFQGIVDWFKNSAVGKFFFGDQEEKEKEDAIEGRGKFQSLEGEGAVDISNDAELSNRDSKDPIAPFFDKQSGEIIQPDNPNYLDIKKRNVNTSEQMLGDDGRIIPMVSEPKSLLAERQVVGNNMADGSDTSDALKFLQNEAQTMEKPVVTNIQNNSNVNSQQSTGTTIAGFVDHEPDTSFKYVRKDNGDQYI